VNIDIFNRLVAHGKILIGENLQKKGFVGSFRCLLCLSREETITNIFLGCDFSIEVYKITLDPLQVFFELHTSVVSLYSAWGSIFPEPLKRDSWFKLCWLTLPKFICWKIWLERNAHIF